MVECNIDGGVCVCFGFGFVKENGECFFWAVLGVEELLEMCERMAEKL